MYEVCVPPSLHVTRYTLSTEAFNNFFYFFPLHLGSTFMCLHVARLYTSSPIVPSLWYHPSTAQPPLLRPSSLPLFYFYFHRPPSYVVILSSHHMPILVQPRFLGFLGDFPHFLCPPDSFIYFPVKLCNSDCTSTYKLEGHFSTRPSDRAKIWHACADRYSHLKKIK